MLITEEDTLLLKMYSSFSIYLRAMNSYPCTVDSVNDISKNKVHRKKKETNKFLLIRCPCRIFCLCRK